MEWVQIIECVEMHCYYYYSHKISLWTKVDRCVHLDSIKNKRNRLNDTPSLYMALTSLIYNLASMTGCNNLLS